MSESMIVGVDHGYAANVIEAIGRRIREVDAELKAGAAA